MPAKRHGTILIVGASSGVGRALAMELAHEARPIAALARRTESLEALADEVLEKVGARRIVPYAHDVTDLESVDPLFTKIEADLGEVDELHYVSGVMPDVAIDEYPTDKDALMVQTNMVGCMAWVNAAARRFAPRRAGHIVGVTSVAGDRGRRDRPGYNASKAGQDTFLESIRNRLWRDGIRVTSIRLGPVETPMTEGIDAPGMISAEAAAKAIVKARSKGKPIAYIPGKWRPIMFVIRSIPGFLFRKLNV